MCYGCTTINGKVNLARNSSPSLPAGVLLIYLVIDVVIEHIYYSITIRVDTYVGGINAQADCGNLLLSADRA